MACVESVSMGFVFAMKKRLFFLLFFAAGKFGPRANNRDSESAQISAPPCCFSFKGTSTVQGSYRL